MSLEFPIAYASFNHLQSIRLRSSSGGVFYRLAEYVFLEQGVVFAATYNDQWEVVHAACENLEKIGKFLGSKYVQSAIGETFILVKKALNLGRKVLFVGTPCQTEGLRCFLNCNYENLILVDLICHGVPSPLVWRKYLSEVTNDAPIHSINFRDKRDGWLLFSPKIELQDGTVIQKAHSEDIYLKAFLKNINLRPSCYECNFKGLNRNTDFTLADFWGVQDVCQGMFDDKGTSLVLIHNNNANNIWQHISEGLKCRSVDIMEALKANSAAIESVKCPTNRNEFFDNFKEHGAIKTIRKYTKASLLTRCKYKLKSMLK